MLSTKFSRAWLECHGWANVTDREAELYAHIENMKLYQNLMDFAFRTAYWTARHVEVLPSDPGYRALQLDARENVVAKALEMIHDGRESYLPMLILSEKEIGVNIHLDAMEVWDNIDKKKRRARLSTTG